MSIQVLHYDWSAIAREMPTYDWEGSELCEYIRDKIEFYSVVAEVESDNLEEAYKLTNTIEYPWQENEGVEAIGAAIERARSSSVGDIFVKAGKAYVVGGVGFIELAWKV